MQFIGLPALILLGDGAAKRMAEKKLSDMRTRKILGGRIWLRLFHNSGAALGAFKKNPGWLLAINSGMLGAVAASLSQMLTGHGNAAAKTGLSLVLGGGASNLLDRLQRGYVTDYFSINAGDRFQKLRSIVFNCSDFCVFIGVLLFVFGKKDDWR